jgi:hypothetical protein
MRARFFDRDRLVLGLLLVAGVVTYFNFENASGHVGGVAELDGYYYYIYLRSMHMDGDLDFANEYRDWGNPFALGPTETGYQRNIFGPGPAITWLPFFVGTHLLVLLGVKLGFPLMLDSMSRFHQVGTFFGSVFYGWLAVVLCTLIARRFWSRGPALLAALGAALAGPLPYYCLTMASYSHAQAAMASALMVWLWLRYREAWSVRRWILFGGSAGLLLLIRPACAGLLLLPLYEGARQILQALRRRRRGRPGRWIRALPGPLCGALAALLVFSPQLVVWQLMFGKLYVTPQGEGFMRWSETAWHATLFSPRNGLLTMAPLMAVALWGLLGAIRRHPGTAGPLALMMAGSLVVNGAAYDWWGWGFSARRFTSALPLLTFGLAAALAWLRDVLQRSPARAFGWIAGLGVAVAVAFNLQWMSNYGAQWMTWSALGSSQTLYMTVTHSLMDRSFRAVGNPLSLPSSLAFTLRRGGSPHVFDRIDGAYLLGESHPDANPSVPQTQATMILSDLTYRYNLSESFGYPQKAGEIRFVPLREPEGHIFLPINRPGKIQMRLGGQALYPGTTLDLVFNGTPVARRRLLAGEWSILSLELPGRLVERGINRLDLLHHLPRGWDAPGPRAIGATGVQSPVDLAVVSGGPRSGNFAEIWVAGRKVSGNVRGINLALLDPGSGEVLGTRDLDVVLRPMLYRELKRYLGRFPRGTVVALATRGKVQVAFGKQGREALALFGAVTDLARLDSPGYAAVGVLGARPGTALEENATQHHARVRLGRPPPPWREVARYRFLQLR